MKFSINAYKYLLGLNDTYRLLRNGDWVKKEDFKTLDETSDWTFDTFQDAQSWLDSTGPVKINGEETSTFPKSEVNFTVRGYLFEIVAHRFSKPENLVITREQLKGTLENGDDRYNNTLVIDYDGIIQLINRSPLTISEFPVRVETFQAGNGYVGHSDLNHLENTYMILLEAWAIHIETGRSIYWDYTSHEKTEQELIDDIISEVNKLN